jgi:hypothetical protein
MHPEIPYWHGFQWRLERPWSVRETMGAPPGATTSLVFRAFTHALEQARRHAEVGLLQRESGGNVRRGPDSILSGAAATNCLTGSGVPPACSSRRTASGMRIRSNSLGRRSWSSVGTRQLIGDVSETTIIQSRAAAGGLWSASAACVRLDRSRGRVRRYNVRIGSAGRS